MKHDTSKALYEYWLSCHRPAGVRPTGIRAAELMPILPSLFLIELLDPDGSGFRFRFCGASVATRYGRDLADESFLALWNPIDAATMKRDLRATAFRSTGLIAGVMMETVASGFTAEEMLLLPLVGENGTAGAIGSMVRIGGHEETNRVRARVVGQSLRSIRFLPRTRPSSPRAEVSVLSALPAAALKTRRRYGHLTVVNGGK
jgi:hypothetical protein